MEKPKKHSVKKILTRLFLAVVSIVLIFVLPLVGSTTDDNLNRIYSIFLGKKSEYSGIIEIWNIDTFESGSAAKTTFLNTVARDFEKKNRGAYVMIRNLTEYECMNLLESGVRPDLFSCSYGVAKKLASATTAFDDSNFTFGAYKNFLDAGKVGDAQVAVPWCFGMYYLISTASNLESAKVDTSKKLSELALISGYTTKGKNNEKITYSLSFGSGAYTLPKIAFKTYTGSELVSTSNTTYSENAGKCTGFEAYSDFVMGKSVMLLGTQRDTYRMANRQKLGKVSDVVYELISGSTDLVQFFMLSSNTEGSKKLLAERFVEFSLLLSSQSQLSKIGMFSPTLACKSLYSEGAMSHITLENIESYKLFNVFDEVFD